jgi:hypothetical protein
LSRGKAHNIDFATFPSTAVYYDTSSVGSDWVTEYEHTIEADDRFIIAMVRGANAASSVGINFMMNGTDITHDTPYAAGPQQPYSSATLFCDPRNYSVGATISVRITSAQATQNVSLAVYVL